MASKSPYFIRITEEELPGFMAGKGDPPRPQTQQQATSEATRWPTWGVVPGLNAFGPGTPSTVTTAPGGRRILPALVIVALAVVVIGSLVVALRMRASDQPVPYAPPATQVEATVAVPALATSPVPTATPAQLYAALPTMTVFCDNIQREYANVREVARMMQTTPGWQRRCVAAYGWCTECQEAWQDAHP